MSNLKWKIDQMQLTKCKSKDGFSMHSNEAICKRNPVEQSMCAQSAFPIRKQPKNEKKKFFAKGVKTFFF